MNSKLAKVLFEGGFCGGFFFHIDTFDNHVKTWACAVPTREGGLFLVVVVVISNVSNFNIQHTVHKGVQKRTVQFVLPNWISNLLWEWLSCHRTPTKWLVHVPYNPGVWALNPFRPSDTCHTNVVFIVHSISPCVSRWKDWRFIQTICIERHLCETVQQLSPVFLKAVLWIHLASGDQVQMEFCLLSVCPAYYSYMPVVSALTHLWFLQLIFLLYPCFNILHKHLPLGKL